MVRCCTKISRESASIHSLHDRLYITTVYPSVPIQHTFGALPSFQRPTPSLMLDYSFFSPSSAGVDTSIASAAGVAPSASAFGGSVPPSPRESTHSLVPLVLPLPSTSIGSSEGGPAASSFASAASSASSRVRSSGSFPTLRRAVTALRVCTSQLSYSISSQ